MSEQRSPYIRAIVVVLLIALALPTAYMVTYYALLKGQISLASPPAPGVPFDLMLEPVYRWDHPLVEKVLEPAHRVDKVIRESHWH